MLTSINAQLKNFIEFIRQQGVVGLAVAFILGGAIQKVVSSVVTDLVNPLIGILLGRIGDLKNLVIHVGAAEVRVGSFLSTLIDFTIIALVIYLLVKVMQINRLDKPKQ